MFIILFNSNTVSTHWFYHQTESNAGFNDEKKYKLHLYNQKNIKFSFEVLNNLDKLLVKFWLFNLNKNVITFLIYLVYSNIYCKQNVCLLKNLSVINRSSYE